MADPVIVRNFRDSYVDSAKPARNYSTTNRLKVKSGTIFSYLFCSKPMPPGAVVTSAILRVWNAETWAGSITLSADRLSGSWAGSRINWNNKPAVTGATASTTKSNAPANTMWEIDVTSIMNLVSQGSLWYGIRLSTNATAVKNMHSAQSGAAELRPQLIIQWSDAPEAPDGLAPDGNRAVSNPKPVLAYDFTDVAGDTTLAMHQIQLSTVSTFATTVFDSGWVATADPQFDLSTSTYAGLTSGASIYWRVRAQDGAGIQSAWSDPAQFSYTPKGTLTSTTLGGPDVNGKYFVQDTTPPVIWSLTGATQASYRVTIVDLARPDVVLYDSKKVTGTTNSIDTGGATGRTLRSSTATYRLLIRVWDTVVREKTPDSTIYYDYQQDFIYAPSATVTSPTLDSVTPIMPWPWIDITFSRSTPPDSFTVFRDGDVVEANLDPGALSVGGTSYTYRDREAAPRIAHTWKVTANVNAVDSSFSNTKTATTKPFITWMMNPDTSSPIALAKSADQPSPVVDAQAMSSQEVHQPVGGTSPVLITQYVSGYEGHVDAVLSDGIINGLSARDMRDRFKVWKRNPGTEVLLFMVDEVLRICPYNMTYRPRAKSGSTIIYDVSFDFFQVSS